MKARLRTVFAIVCIFVVTISAVLSVHALSGRAGADLTEQGLYTLSDGTRNILNGLNDRVMLTLYYSRAAALQAGEEIRHYNNYFLYVRDLLNEYSRLSNGMVRYSVVDPRKFTEEEDDAYHSGVKRIPLSAEENFYFGLVAKTEYGRNAVIPLFETDRQEFVEYDISRIISTVAQRDTKRIGVLSPLSVSDDALPPNMRYLRQGLGKPKDPWGVMVKLRKDYELEAVDVNAGFVCAEIDYLMVIHPKNLPRKMLYAIDQFVMRGGKLLVFTDPCCLEDEPPLKSDNPSDPANIHLAMTYKSSSELNELLRGWGVEMEPDVVAVDHALALPAGNPDEPLPIFMALTEQCINQDEPVTAALRMLTTLYAGSLKQVPGAGTTVTPLLTTTERGNTWKPNSPVELRIPRPKVFAAIPDGQAPVMLACSIRGKFKSNFPDAIEKTPDETSANNAQAGDADEHHTHGEHQHIHADLPHMLASQGDPVVFVFADVDMFTNRLAFKTAQTGPVAIGDNFNLMLNTLEYLRGTQDLIAIRSRGPISRPFTRVDEIEAALEKDSRERIAVVEKKIAEYESALKNLGASGEDSSSQLQSQVLEERKKLQEAVDSARRDLRMLKAGKRGELERIKMSLMGVTMAVMPGIVLLIAIGLGLARFIRMKRYVARRTR